MSTAAEEIRRIAERSGVPLSVQDDTLMVEGTAVRLPPRRPGKLKSGLAGETADLMGIQGILPTVPHGDDRDKLLWRVVSEATDREDIRQLDDRPLLEDLPQRLGLGGEASRAAALALEDRFFSRGGLMLPVHASLPLNYRQVRKAGTPMSYTMFSGAILPFLLWDTGAEGGAGPDVELLQALLDSFADDEELTALDRLFLEVAMQNATQPDAKPVAEQLLQRYRADIEHDMAAAGGPFCEPSLALFARDLRTVLNTPLPRPERARWLTQLLSLHLALRMYRVAIGLGGGLDMAVAAAWGHEAPEGAECCTCSGRALEQLERCPLAGKIRFRTGTGRYRPVRASDGCRISYLAVDRTRLMDLPATLVTRTLACRAWEALGGGEPARRLDLAALATALRADPVLRHKHGAACAALAVMHHAAHEAGSSLEELEEAGRTGPDRPGLHALRADVRRMRGRGGGLRKQGVEVVNQLMLAANVGTGALLARNGRSFTFFEVDEQLLLLLVRLICASADSGVVPLERFLSDLRLYGLAPQDDQERDALASTLERLGLLERYSDAGEASFVRFA